MKALLGVRALILVGLLSTLTGAAYYAGRIGTGVPKPLRNPIWFRA